MITVLAFLAVAPPSDPPGMGTRITTELGVGKYDASYEVNHYDNVAKTGVDGIGARVQSTLGFAVVPGFVLGPSVGLQYAATKLSGSICCKSFNSTWAARVGIEASYYPNARVGFRVVGGFGIAAASLVAPISDVDPVEGGPVDIVETSMGVGSYWTIGIARDWALARKTRIGGTLRLEAESIRGRDDERERRFHFNALTPSLSFVLVTGL